MAAYSAADIIGRTLTAKKTINVYKFPVDDSELLGQIHPGQTVGVVYSYLDAAPGANRSSLFWMFAPDPLGGNYFYTRHQEGDYDVSALKQQGVLTTQEKAKAAAEKAKYENMAWYEKALKQFLPYALGAVVVVSLVPQLFKKTR